MKRSPLTAAVAVLAGALSVASPRVARADDAPPLPSPPAPVPKPQDALPPPAAQPTAAAPTPAVPSGVLLRFGSDDKRATLWQSDPTRKVFLRDEASDVYTFVCTAPCEERVAAEGRYRVMGQGIVPSKPFTLPSGASSATVLTSTGSMGVRRAGYLAGGVTVLAAVFSAFMFVSESSARDSASAFGSAMPQSRDHLLEKADTYRTVGIVSIAVACASALTSVVLLAAGKTTVDVSK